MSFLHRVLSLTVTCRATSCWLTCSSISIHMSINISISNKSSIIIWNVLLKVPIMLESGVFCCSISFSMNRFSFRLPLYSKWILVYENLIFSLFYVICVCDISIPIVCEICLLFLFFLRWTKDLVLLSKNIQLLEHEKKCSRVSLLYGYTFWLLNKIMFSYERLSEISAQEQGIFLLKSRISCRMFSVWY